MRVFLMVIGCFGWAIWAIGLLILMDESARNGTIFQELADLVVCGFGALIGVTGLGFSALVAALEKRPAGNENGPWG